RPAFKAASQSLASPSRDARWDVWLCATSFSCSTIRTAHRCRASSNTARSTKRPSPHLGAESVGHGAVTLGLDPQIVLAQRGRSLRYADVDQVRPGIVEGDGPPVVSGRDVVVLHALGQGTDLVGGRHHDV